MFQLDPSPTFKATVKIPAPGGESFDLKVTFKHRTRDELKAYWSDATAGKMEDLAAVMQVLDGWEDVSAKFSEEAVAKLLQNYHGAASAIFQSYLKELTQASLGN